MNGDWFSWLSHDDGYYPEKIERQVETINFLSQKEHLPVEDYVIYGANEIIDSKGNVILKKKHKFNNQSVALDPTLLKNFLPLPFRYQHCLLHVIRNAVNPMVTIPDLFI